MNRWVKTGLVAIGGGAFAAFVTDLVDPEGFNIRTGTGKEHLWLAAIQGAAVGLVGLFLHSPFGQKFMEQYKQLQAQTAQDKKTIEELKQKMIQKP